MKYEWDESKNKANIRKHGIDFTDVIQMFDYPMVTGLDQHGDHEEDRWIGIGILKDIIAVVVFTERDESTLRIISARKATKYERKKYQEALKN